MKSLLISIMQSVALDSGDPFSAVVLLGYPNKFANLSTLWLMRFTERISCSLSSLKTLWATKVGLGGYVVNRGGGGGWGPRFAC